MDYYGFINVYSCIYGFIRLCLTIGYPSTKILWFIIIYAVNIKIVGFPSCSDKPSYGVEQKNRSKNGKIHHNFKPIGIIILFLVFNLGAFWK
jgi:hypothetical protein